MSERRAGLVSWLGEGLAGLCAHPAVGPVTDTPVRSPSAALRSTRAVNHLFDVHQDEADQGTDQGLPWGDGTAEARRCWRHESTDGGQT
jgi:hypothetical protein